MPQTSHTDQQHRALLQSIARRAMLERGLLPDFSAACLQYAIALVVGITRIYVGRTTRGGTCCRGSS